MGQHYVPQYYLRGFATPSNNKMIWMYERGKARGRCIAIQKAAQQRGYYLEEDEIKLAQEIETPANRVLGNIRSGHWTITSAERMVLADYMAVMLKRVPRARQRVRELAPNVIDEVLSKFATQLQEAAVRDSSPDSTLVARQSELQQIRSKLLPNVPDDLVQQMSRPVLTPRLSDVLFHMPWTIGVRVCDLHLVTSDNPLVYSERIGLGNPAAEFLFPLCSDVLLYGSHRNPLSYAPVFLSLGDVKMVNEAVIASATRFVFASTPDSSISTRLLKR